MKRIHYPEPIHTLIQHLKRLPGVGSRSAERIALWMQRESPDFSQAFSEAIQKARREVAPCDVCGFFAARNHCDLCEDLTRDDSQLCIVEQALDVIALEKSGGFRGRYHVLGGRLSPLHHIGPRELRIEGLLQRLKNEAIHEVIFALGQDVEGDATANYLAGLLAKTGIRLTRLAQGLPAGSGLEAADELTLFRALSGRRDWREDT